MALEIVPSGYEFNVVLSDFWNRDIDAREISSKMLGKAASLQECVKKVQVTTGILLSPPTRGRDREFFCRVIISIDGMKKPFSDSFNEFMNSIKEMNEYCDNVIKAADRLSTKTEVVNAKNALNALKERIGLICCNSFVSLNYTSFVIRNYIVRVS